MLLFVFAVVMPSCKVGNKVIPDPTGNIPVDTTGTLGSFTMIVTGDTSFNVTMISDTSSTTGNFVVNDSLQILGLDANNVVAFSTAESVAGTYYTETAPPDITSAVFIYQVKIGTVVKRYFMPHGKIIITENDAVTGVVKGSFDVNNEFVTTADRTLFLRANFVLRYKVR